MKYAFVLVPREFRRKISDRADRSQPKFRNVDSQILGQRHHREFVFRHFGESWRRQFHDRLAVPSLSRNVKLFAAEADRGEFELNAGEREPSTSCLFASCVPDLPSVGGSGCPPLSSAITVPGGSVPTSHSNGNSLSGLIPARCIGILLLFAAVRGAAHRQLKGVPLNVRVTGSQISVLRDPCELELRGTEEPPRRREQLRLPKRS